MILSKTTILVVRGLDQLQNKIVHKSGRERGEREREREREWNVKGLNCYNQLWLKRTEQRLFWW